MADENKSTQALSPREKFERRQAGKQRTIENNPNAIIIVPESLVTRDLINGIRTFDAVDSLVRARAGMQISFDEFGEHVKVFQELAKTMEDTNQKVVDMLAKNANIELRIIRDRFLRDAVETRRKELKKAVTPATPKDKKEK